MIAALLISMSLSACTTTKTAQERALEAAQIQGLLNAQEYPDLPDDCRTREKSGVKKGHRQDTALIRTDQALGRANDRVIRCAGWYDDQTKAKVDFD